MEPAQCELQVWRIPVEGDASGFEPLLSAGERQRCARFRHERQRSRWMRAHGAMRQILAVCLGCAPSGLVFDANPFGKPFLSWPRSDLSFNLTYAGGIALLAVGRGGKVGVDAEPIRDGIEIEELSRRYFAPEEASEIMAQRVEARPLAFFQTWSRKEAYLKSLGCGLSMPLSSFRVSVGVDEPARVLRSDVCQSDHRSYLFDLGEASFAATTAFVGARPRLRRLNFPES